MGGTQSVEIPGGGSEGYHVLRVGIWYRYVFCMRLSCVSGSCQDANAANERVRGGVRRKSRPGMFDAACSTWLMLTLHVEKSHTFSHTVLISV